jgi:hypothetical protein
MQLLEAQCLKNQLLKLLAEIKNYEAINLFADLQKNLPG